MATVLTILGLTLAVAAWDLTGEPAADYDAEVENLVALSTEALRARSRNDAG